MKKTVLLCLLVILKFFPALSQKSLLISDSTILSDSRSNGAYINDWEMHTYNSRCLDSIYQSYNNDFFLDSGIRFKDYYPNDKLYHQIYQKWDSTVHMYVNSSRITTYYTTGNQISTANTDKWVNNSWQPSNLAAHYYNVTGTTDTIVSQYWNNISQTYINQYRFISAFDNSGNETDYLSQNWDVSSQSWISQYDFSFTYDTAGHIIEQSYSNTDFYTDVYGIASHSYYYLGYQGRIDSAYTAYYDYDDSARFYYTYDFLSVKPNKQVAYTYRSNGTLSSGVVLDYFYDTTGNTFIDSSLYKTFITTPESATFISTSVTQRTYNEYNQQTHYLSQTFNADGSFDRSTEEVHHYAPCSSVLPLTFLSFTAQRINNDALLQWKTANEINTSYFIIQRSTDGMHFMPVSRINASANSSAISTYQYTDIGINNLNSSKLYYRLVETDKDGKITYSPTALLTFNGNTLSVSVSPNPVQNLIYIYSNVSLINALVNITNSSGALLYTNQRNISAGERTAIDVSSFINGMYILTIQSAAGKRVFKLVK